MWNVIKSVERKGKMPPGRLLSGILFLLILSGCPGKPDAISEDPAFRGVVDFRGKRISTDKKPARVICLIESALSGIYMLHQEECLVGIPASTYDANTFPYYAKLDARIQNRGIPVAGNWDFISLEQIVGLEPDLVIIWASQQEAIEQIERLGIPVYAVMIHSFADVFKEIRDFGQLFYCSERADSLIRFAEESLRGFKNRPDMENRPRVYFMWAQGITETSGQNSTVNELLEAAGTINICRMEPEHVTVSIEKIYDWDPDLIVMWHNDRLDPADILSDPLLRGLRAVQNGRVYELPDVFSCDFWTLKFVHPVRLIHSWAFENTDTGENGSDLNELVYNLYGKQLVE